jgi:hypothetical protein
MPRIPVPQSNPQLPRPIFSGDQFGAQQGRALQGLGQSVANVGAALVAREKLREEEKAKEEISRINKELAAARADLTIGLRAEAENADPADTGVEERLNNTVKARLESIGAMATTDAAKEFFGAQSSSAIADFRISANKVQADLAGNRRAAEYEDSANLLTANIVSDPDSFFGALDQSRATLSALLKPAEFAAALPKEQERLAVARIEGMVAGDRASEAVEELLRGDLDEYLSGEKKAQLLRSAQSHVKAEKDYARQLQLLEWQDDAPQIALTGDLGAWSRERLVGLADNPVDAVRFGRDFDRAAAIGAASKSYLDATLPDILRDVDSSQAALGSAKEFGTAKAAFDAKAEAARNIFESYKKDPAQATIDRRPAVKSAYEDFVKAPSESSFARYYELSRTAQERDIPGVTPASLPKAFINNVAQQLSDTKVDGGAESAAAMLADLQRIAGRRWPEVSRDLYAEKALSDDQFVAASVQTKNRPALARDLLRVSELKDEDLNALAGAPGARNEAKAAAVRALEPLYVSLAGEPGGLQVANAYTNSLEKLILFRQSQGKRMSSREVRALANDLVMDEYSFEGALRIPVTVDRRVARRGLQKELDALKPELIAAPAGSGDYLARVRAAGYWVSNSDGTGAKLVDESGAPVMARSGGRLVQVQRRWEDLQ